MKRSLIPLLALLIPSAHAVDYVKCEAIRAVIMRNELQMKEERKLARSFFPTIKAREKYGTPSPEFLRKKGDVCWMYGGETLSSKEYKECENFKKTVWSNFKSEGEKYIANEILPFVEIESRATKDFEKNGCYWF